MITMPNLNELTLGLNLIKVYKKLQNFSDKLDELTGQGENALHFCETDLEDIILEVLHFPVSDDDSMEFVYGIIYQFDDPDEALEKVMMALEELIKEENEEDYSI